VRILYVCLIVGSLHTLPAAAQFEFRSIGSRSASLGGIHTVLSGDIWGSLTNPAGLTTFQTPVFSSTFSPYQFGLSELRSTAAGFVYPVNRLYTGVSVHRFGYDLYNETTFSLAFAGDVGDRFSLGAVFHWYHLNIDGYGSAGVPGLSIGIHSKITGNLLIGVTLINLNRPAIGENSNQLPQILLSGVCYSPHPLLNLFGEFKKDILFPIEFSAGIELRLSEYLAFRAGLNDKRSSTAGGLHLNISRFGFEYTYKWHVLLGQTHVFTVSVNFPPRNKRREYIELQAGGEVPRTPIHIPSIPFPVTKATATPNENRTGQEKISIVEFLNNAQVKDLIALPGIGSVLAARIVAYRDRMGQFSTIRDLLSVSGIGEILLERIRNYWENLPD
jgi:competence ComEA-like helix-hairpin-helix protein